MNIKDLPEFVTVNLSEESGVKYPKNGDFETAYQVDLLCFNKKIYTQTWPLRTRLMQVFTKGLLGELSSLAENAEKKEEDSQMTGEDLMNACLIGGFDAMAALEEFKQAIVGNGLIKLDEDVSLSKQRWNDLDGDVQETILFEYLANFIQPCVLTGTAKS